METGIDITKSRLALTVLNSVFGEHTKLAL